MPFSETFTPPFTQSQLRHCNIDLLLGDSNINALEAKHQDRLSISLAGYTHIIHESTHLGGDFLDHFLC